MSTYNYMPGLNHVGSYQVSGIPYVTSSLTVPNSSSTALEISFPKITREYTVRNDGLQDIKIAYSENGLAGSNFFVLDPGQSFSTPVRVTEIYLLSSDGSTGSATVTAVLTGIDRNLLPNNWSGSVGVG